MYSKPEEPGVELSELLHCRGSAESVIFGGGFIFIKTGNAINGLSYKDIFRIQFNIVQPVAYHFSVCGERL